MPSNRELKDEAEALSKELGVSVDTDGLTNKQLQELVDGLYQQLDAKDVAPEPEPSPEPEPEPEPEPKAETPPVSVAPQAKPVAKYEYTVGPRCSIVGPRGVLGPGREVLLADFGPDQEAAKREIARHIAAGRILKR